MRRFWNCIWTALALLMPLCASGQTARHKFIFSPQSPAQAQFAGYYVAFEKGFYAEEGLDVIIVHPFSTQAANEKIKNGECNATTLPLTLAMKTIVGGTPLVNILQTSMNSASMIVSRLGEDPMKLQGAKVAIPRAGFGEMARCMAAKEGLNYQWIETASCVNLFVSGAVDATLARSYNEYFQLLQTGLIQPGETKVFHFKDRGYNIQQEGVYVTRAYYERHREEAERFARASRRGWEWTVEHPEEALEIVMEYVRKYRIATNRPLQQRMLEEVLNLQLDPDSGEREFRLRTDMVEKAGRFLSETGMLSRVVTYEELMP